MSCLFIWIPRGYHELIPNFTSGINTLSIHLSTYALFIYLSFIFLFFKNLMQTTGLIGEFQCF